MTHPILIAGGGIGGLCAASVLARAMKDPKHFRQVLKRVRSELGLQG